MLVEQTVGAIEKSFVHDHQHGGDNVTCKPRMLLKLLVVEQWLTRTSKTICKFITQSTQPFYSVHSSLVRSPMDGSTEDERV